MFNPLEMLSTTCDRGNAASSRPVYHNPPSLKIQRLPPPSRAVRPIPQSNQTLEAIDSIWRFGMAMSDPTAAVIPKPDGGDDESVEIREVWADNLEEEFALIRDIVDEFPFVAMDTEFPGIVCRPIGAFRSPADYNYATLKANVDMLHLIQLGLTFSGPRGELPALGAGRRRCVWQFNFREFDDARDIFASDSIELLRRSGIDFRRNAERGVDARRFAELLMSSGVVLNDSVYWVTFHAGYDFGYLLKILTCNSLPDTQAGFFKLMKIYFPTVYDIKHLMKFCNSLHGGLNKLAELLDVERVGESHQAGSDSLVTSCAFWKLRDSFFAGSTEKYAGVLYGLNAENGVSAH